MQLHPPSPPQMEGVLNVMQSQARRDADACSRLKDELRVVYVELAARDRELNAMTASHAAQMEAWVGCEAVVVMAMVPVVWLWLWFQCVVMDMVPVVLL